jgi:hypothetical protein
VGTVVVVLLLIAGFAIVAGQGGSSDKATLDQPASAAVVSEVTSVPADVLAAVGTGGLPNPLRAIAGPSLSSAGRPEVLYIGGDFCPVCAAARWGLVNVLSRFGTFSNLHYTRSAVDDGDLATFTFHGSSYSSAYLSFVPIEHEDRDRNILEPLTDEQQRLLATIGGNGYPFLDFAGRYANMAPNTYGGGYDAQLLSGRDWPQIAGVLKDAKDPLTRAIVGSANYWTAAICAVTHNQPASTCNTLTILPIARQLPHPQ